MSHPKGGAPCQVTVSADKQWSCGPYDTGPGTYWVQASQSMLVGQTTQQIGDGVTRHYSVVQDQPPGPPVAAVAIDTPNAGQTVQVPYTVSGTAQPGVQVTVSGAGLPSHPNIDVQPDGTWSTVYGGDTPLQGSFTITAEQFLDQISKGTSAPVSYQVAAAPVAIDNPSPGATVTVPYTVSGTAQFGTTVTVTGAGLPTYSNIPVNAQGVWFKQYGSDTPSQGSFTITATQYGANAQSLGSSAPVSYQVGSTASLAIDAPLQDQTVYLPYTISGTGAPGDTVKVDVVGIPSRSAPVQGDGTWSLTYGGSDDQAPAGPRTATATQYAGQQQVGQPTPTRSFQLATGAPTSVAITSPQDRQEIPIPGPYSGVRYLVRGTGASGAQVTVSQQGGTGGPVTVPVDENGNWQTDAIFEPPYPQNAQNCYWDAYSCKSGPGTVTASETYGGQKVNDQSITIYGVIDIKR
jgi:hypothetical protein